MKLHNRSNTYIYLNRICTSSIGPPSPPTTTPEVCTDYCFDCLIGCQLVPGTKCTYKCMDHGPM